MNRWISSSPSRKRRFEIRSALLASFWKRSLEVSGKVQFQGRHLTHWKGLGGRNAGKVPGIEFDLTRCGLASAVRADALI